jgi:hypothetical protein
MTTAAEMMLKIEHTSKMIEAAAASVHNDLFLVLSPQVYKDVDKHHAIQRGCPMGKHARMGGVRGRKKALYRSWRSVQRPACQVSLTDAYLASTGLGTSFVQVILKP